MICLCLTGSTMDENAELLRHYRSYVDLVELRVDLLDRSERERFQRDPGRVLGAFPRVKRILTCRRESDGGAWTDSEHERIAVLQALIAGGFDYVDIEDDLEDSVMYSLVSRGSRPIRSIHDLTGVPDDPAAVLERLSRNSAIAKLACSVRNTEDVARLVDAALERPMGTHVTLGMGDYGKVTRLLAGRIGSAWTYTSAAGAVSAAPGQVDPRALVEYFMYRGMERASAVFAVVGDPVEHSKSPEYHNSRFRRDKLNAVYIPFLTSDMTAFLRIARAVGIAGASVTVPHKHAAAEQADQVDDTVKQTGACNTLIREADMYLGTNTDIPGFLDPLESFLDRLGSATVIGAGGAARAVAYALLSRGTDVLIVNRTESRAHALAGALNESLRTLPSRREGVRPGSARSAGLPADSSALQGYDSLIVQTTSCGMSPHTDADPVPGYQFGGHEIVYDIIYTPSVTRLLERAESSGCTVISGVRMFEAQAEIQYELFRRAYWSLKRREASETPRYNGVNRQADRAPWDEE
ncbi:MAG: type I 3-dehydroquinate dehydratase [Spirochaetia bacterium]